MRAHKVATFRGGAHVGKDRRQMQVGEAEVGAAEPRHVAKNALVLGQGELDLGYRVGHRLVVRRALHHRHDHALPYQLADDRAVAERVGDADGLVHHCQAPRVGRLQRRAGEGAVDVAGDHVGFVQPQPVMLERRHFAIRVALEERRLLVLALEHPDMAEIIGDGLFRQRQPHGADIGAVRRSINDRLCHVALPGCAATYDRRRAA